MTDTIDTPTTVPGEVIEGTGPASRVGTGYWSNLALVGFYDTIDREAQACMAEAGFEREVETNGEDESAFVLDPGMTDSEFVEDYGWGYSTIRNGPFLMGAKLRVNPTE